jgi:hypothetical protein
MLLFHFLINRWQPSALLCLPLAKGYILLTGIHQESESDITGQQQGLTETASSCHLTFKHRTLETAVVQAGQSLFKCPLLLSVPLRAPKLFQALCLKMLYLITIFMINDWN